MPPIDEYIQNLHIGQTRWEVVMLFDTEETAKSAAEHFKEEGYIAHAREVAT